MLPLLIAFFLAGIVSLTAWKTGALTFSGAIAATLTGGIALGLGGLSWATLLLVFFISSSSLSRVFKSQKVALAEKFSKGSRRDWGQVVANGGMGAILAVLHVSFPAQVWPWLVYAGALAAVNADTWATELGVLSHARPRLITSGKPVEKGTSGGVSFLGGLASLGGAATIGIVAVVLAPAPGWLSRAGIISIAGLSGSIFDSLLGATIQAIYTCPACQKETEQHPSHACGSTTYLTRGWPWLNNDLVNGFASGFGAMVAFLLWFIGS